jgi:hypothetical protein
MCTAKLLQSDNNNLKYLGVNALSAIVKVHVGSCYGCDCVRADLSLSQASHSHHALCGAVLCNSMRPAADTDYLAACICVMVHFPEPARMPAFMRGMQRCARFLARDWVCACVRGCDDHQATWTSVRALQINPKAAAEHQMIVIECLEDPDETLKRNTLDLLFTMTNPKNIHVVAAKMLDALRNTLDE